MQMMMKMNKENKRHFIGFSLFATLLLVWFVYAGLTGWRIFSSSGSGQTWSSSGPGYHK